MSGEQQPQRGSRVTQLVASAPCPCDLSSAWSWRNAGCYNHDAHPIRALLAADGGWGLEGNGSGPGSTFNATVSIREILAEAIAALDINSMIDVPCGGAPARLPVPWAPAPAAGRRGAVPLQHSTACCAPRWQVCRTLAGPR